MKMARKKKQKIVRENFSISTVLSVKKYSEGYKWDAYHSLFWGF